MIVHAHTSNQPASRKPQRKPEPPGLTRDHHEALARPTLRRDLREQLTHFYELLARAAERAATLLWAEANSDECSPPLREQYRADARVYHEEAIQNRQRAYEAAIGERGLELLTGREAGSDERVLERLANL